MSDLMDNTLAQTVRPATASYRQEGVCTATAHANIALVKYWGKKDTGLRLPTADSVSMTVDALYTTTRVRILPRGGHFSFSLDGLQIQGPAADRVHRYVAALQHRFGLAGPVSVERQPRAHQRRARLLVLGVRGPCARLRRCLQPRRRPA